MSKLRMLLFAVIGILASSMTAFAQAARKPATMRVQLTSTERWPRDRFRDRGFGGASDSRALALRRAKARRVTRRCRSYPDDDDSWSGADRVAGAVCAAGDLRGRQTSVA
jgi:hypothetical protein